MAEARVIVLTGPTATGKTALAVALAQKLGGEVVSADSMQLYRGMDIGTAKPTAAEMGGVPHHMFDVADPTEDYSVSRYVEDASACVDDILARGKRPVLVGGTNLYIDSLLSGRSFAEKGDGALREKLGAEYDAQGGEAMLARLAAVDAERAAKLAPGDKRRIVRALEIFALTGKTISAHDAETRERPPRWPSVRFALNFADREDLYARIDRRVDAMMAQGLEGEVRALLARGVPPEATAMQAIGYKEIAEALRGACTMEEAVARIKQGSRRYAKRQLTWLRRDKALRWIVWDGEPDLARGLSELLAAL
jgi:tRNA dimethylallyltransferase